jgi:Fe-S-cluster containining protein
MTMRADTSPTSFFKSLAQTFRGAIRARRDRVDLVGALCAQAFDSFERNVVLQAKNAPQPACRGECAAFCALRVTASAPEILLLGRFIDVNEPNFTAHGVDLRGRFAQLGASVSGLSERERLGLRESCPMLEGGLCLAYRLRPLACRGHAAFDADACRAATDGDDAPLSVSTPHLILRSMVQNALLSALRDEGLSWRLYELNQAIDIALRTPEAAEAWIAGDDPFAPAAVAEFDMKEASAIYDAITRH